MSVGLAMGDDRPLTSQELLEDPKIPPIAKAIFAILEATPAGLTKIQISHKLGISGRSTERNLARLPWNAVHAKYNSGGPNGRQTTYYIPAAFLLQRDSEWSGVARSVDPNRLADKPGLTLEEALTAAAEILLEEGRVP